jgi:hypothetical protein
MQLAERRRGLNDVHDVGHGGDRADQERGDEHPAADEQDACGSGAVVPAPPVSCLSRHVLSKARLPIEV